MTETTRRADLTFVGNRNRGRHGWLRLTPAYSVKLVHELLADNEAQSVLDPFSGTGTTGLVCAEAGLHCDLIDVNPFLIWLARTKTANYDVTVLGAVRAWSEDVEKNVFATKTPPWVPAIANIERWWEPDRCDLLGRIREEIQRAFPQSSDARDLVLLAFCRCVIDWSNAAFNHQSMSFKKPMPSLFERDDRGTLLAEFRHRLAEIVAAAQDYLPGSVSVREGDSRALPSPTGALYDLVITSPPYPNRMSYVRELRPYMYWLGYLTEAREAGELDWKAIGGTWGIATSRTLAWTASGARIEHDGFDSTISQISSNSPVLGNYVHKYFADMILHFESLLPSVAPEGRICYVVGNSKFYDTMVDVERILGSIMLQVGFVDVQINTIRKRNSKKELFEFAVNAKKG